MASIRLEPHESFDFKNADDWPRWKRRFGLYRSASALEKILNMSKKQVLIKEQNAVSYCSRLLE